MNTTDFDQTIGTARPDATGLRPSPAAAFASAAFLLPLALSASSAPSPNHPRTLAWYKSLREPAFKPPDWVIPVAWSAIEAGLAGAAYRLLRAAPSRARTRALGLLGWNVAMIGGWSRIFFRRRALAASTAAAVTMVATGVAYVAVARKVARPAARAGIPFVAWVGFATVLTATIWRMNSRR